MAKVSAALDVDHAPGSRTRCHRAVAAALWLPLAVLAGVQPARAIVTTDDPNASHHLVQPDSAYNMVGYVNLLGGTSGVLIGPRHVLTAEHVVQFVTDPTIIVFQLDLPDGPHLYHGAQLYKHDDADLALLILAENTGLTGYGLYHNSDELGKTASIVGYGEFGTGETGGQPPRGTSRIAWNVIDRTYYPTPGYDDILGYDFDRPDGTNGPWGGASLGEALEGSLGLGDSGGGLFIEVGGVPLLAGIHSEVKTLGGGSEVGYYGDRGLDVRISQHLDWINQQIRGDANWDGRVDGADYTIWADHYGLTGVPAWSAGGWSVGNFNEDTTVDGADYTLWADNYLFGTGTDGWGSGGASVFLPEPGTLVLLALGGAVLARRRR